MTTEPSQQGKYLCNTNRTNNSINLKKGQHRGIEDLIKCSPIFLLFYFDEIEGVSRSTKQYVKNGRKGLSLLTSCHKILRNMPPVGVWRIF